jgi:hypothetical protein
MTVIHHVSRRLAFGDHQLDKLAREFAEYAALDIADIVRLHLPFHEQQYRIALIATEVAHAIRCAVDALTVTAAPINPHRSPGPREADPLESLTPRCA